MSAWAGQTLQVTGGGGATVGSAAAVDEGGEVDVDVVAGLDPHAATASVSAVSPTPHHARAVRDPRRGATKQTVSAASGASPESAELAVFDIRRAQRPPTA